MSNLSDWPTQYNRSGSYRPSFTVPPAALRLLFLTISSTYLGTKVRCRNATALSIRQRYWNLRKMTTFDKREEGFEKKFALDEEQRFKAEARRNKLLGLWAAEQLGLSGEEANAYAREVVAAEIEAGGEAGVLRKVTGDLAGKGAAIPEQQIRIKMQELMTQAVAQVKAGR